MLTPTDQLLLCTFVFSIGLGIGGGVYETRVVYPNWRVNPIPSELGKKLVSSGQAGAARRFWPFISPVSALLAIINAYIAWHQVGLVRNVWLAAAVSIILKSVGTYGYFVPTYIRRISQPESMEVSTLRNVVRTWTALSPLRIWIELFAWTAGMWTLLIASKS
jgi:hypothetical protein